MNTIHVLLIDDNDHDVYITKQHLKRIRNNCQYEVSAVTDMQIALTALKKPYDICLLDFNLGALTAFELLDQVGHENLQGPIILLTGNEESEHFDPAQHQVIADYLYKPSADSNTLARSIRYAMRDYQTLKRLQFLANHDALTGLYMRAHFNQQLAQFLARFDAGGPSFAVFYIDLDGFKAVNDQHGHDVGDEVIKQAAARLQSCFRSTDVVARYGGDEFVAIVDVSDEAAANQVGRKVLNAFRGQISIGSKLFQCTASLGIAFALERHLTPEEIMRRADHAMYLAKRAGKDTLRVFSTSLDALSPNSLSRGDALRKAVASNEINLRYQPFFSISSKQILGAEALLRWQDETHGAMPVDQVLLLAEELSLTRELDRAVLKSVGRDISKLDKQCKLAPDFMLSVNIEPAALTDSEFAPFIEELISSCPALKGRLALEVVERALLPDHHEILMTLERIQSFGVPVLIDDFGTGHSALSYLAKLPVSGFKLDKEIISDIDSNPRSKLLIEGVTSLAKELNLTIITEGIETEEQIAQLQSTDCQIGQGFFFAPDLSISELSKRIKAFK